MVLLNLGGSLLNLRFSDRPKGAFRWAIQSDVDRVFNNGHRHILQNSLV